MTRNRATARQRGNETQNLVACRVCGNPVTGRRRVYCSNECYAKSQTNTGRQAPCKACGGAKEPGRRGSKYCLACVELMADAHVQYEIERNRRRVVEEREARLAAGERLSRRDDAPPGEKWCPRCQSFKKFAAFAARSSRPAKWVAYCKPCQRSYNRERRIQNVYGLTYDEFDLMLACQDGRCAICGGRPRKYGLAIDHDHKTGEIRGLLCSRCNHRLLGSANEDPERLRRAADYLENTRASDVFGTPKFIPGFGGDAA